MGLQNYCWGLGQHRRLRSLKGLSYSLMVLKRESPTSGKRCPTNNAWSPCMPHPRPITTCKEYQRKGFRLAKNYPRWKQGTMWRAQENTNNSVNRKQFWLFKGITVLISCEFYHLCSREIHTMIALSEVRRQKKLTVARFCHVVKL